MAIEHLFSDKVNERISETLLDACNKQKPKQKISTQLAVSTIGELDECLKLFQEVTGERASRHGLMVLLIQVGCNEFSEYLRNELNAGQS